MATSSNNAFKAGLLIVLCFALAVAVFFAIRGATVLESKQTRVAVFKLTDNIGGLKIGDDVRIGGYKVGAISSISLDTTRGDQPVIAIHFAMPSKYILREGARIRIETLATGTSNLNFSEMGSGRELPPGEALQGEPSNFTAILAELAEITPLVKGTVLDVRQKTIPELNAALASARQAADEVRGQVPKLSSTIQSFSDAAAEARGLASDLRKQVDPVVGRYNKVADAAARAGGEVADLLGDTKTDLRQTAANLRSASDKLPGVIQQVSEFVASTQKTVNSINESLTDIKTTIANSRDATGNLRDVLANNRGRIDTIFQSVKNTADNLENASADIRRSPWRLLYQPGKDEVGNLNIFDSAREFARGASDLNDAAAALRDAARNPATNPEQLKKLMDRLDKAFGNFSDTEQKLYKSVRE